MQYRTLGKTGLRVSEVGLGAAEIGWSEASDAEAERVLKSALDLGINLLDTAAMYWRSEERIGRYLHNRRDEFIVASKCGDYAVLEDGSFRTIVDYSPEGILSTIERSLQKLRTDVIDIMQFHGLPPAGAARQEAFAALLEARDRGWVRFVGVSGDQALDELEMEWLPIDTQEFSYNILLQEPAQTLMPTLTKRNVGTIIKHPIACAVYLFDDRPKQGTWAASGPWDRAQRLNVRELAGDMHPVEFALRFALSHPGVHTAIVGTTNVKHLEANVRASDGRPLPREIIERTERLFRETFGDES